MEAKTQNDNLENYFEKVERIPGQFSATKMAGKIACLRDNSGTMFSRRVFVELF